MQKLNWNRSRSTNLL